MSHTPSEHHHQGLVECLNCKTQLPPDATFCHICGQRVGPALISLKDIFSDFFDSVFNVNSRFFLTLGHLFIPGYLTQQFFRGKRAGYISPLRLFFVALITLFAILGVIYFGDVESSIDGQTPYQAYQVNQKAREMVSNTILHIGYDTLDTSQRAILDTLKHALPEFDEKTVDLQLTVTNNAKVALTPDEVYGMPIDTVLARHQLKSFGERLITRQLILAQRNPAKVIQQAIANSTWMILLLMPVLAFVLKLLYIRRNMYFVQHLVFLFHFHAAAFVALILYFPLLDLMPGMTAVIIPMAIFIFLLAAMKRFYAQRWFKTVMKYGLLLISYLSFLILFMLITVVVSLMLFH